MGYQYLGGDGRFMGFMVMGGSQMGGGMMRGGMMYMDGCQWSRSSSTLPWVLTGLLSAAVVGLTVALAVK